MGLENIFGALALDATLAATNTKLDAILNELAAKLESGEAVNLSPSTLAALESIQSTISNFPNDYPDAALLAKLEQVRALLSGQLSVNVGLTDAQLRAAAVPVSISNQPTDYPNASLLSKLEQVRVLLAGTLAVNVGLTNAELRAAALEVSAAALPLPNGAATDATIASTNTKLDAINAKIPALGQAVAAFSQPVVFASDQPSLNTVEPATILTGAAAQTATVNNILSDPSGAAALDVANFRSMSVQVVSTGTGGTFIFEQSNDGVSFIALPVFNAALVTGVPITAAITATASQIVYTFPIRCRYVRLRIATTITGGSIRAFSRISTEPWTAAAQLVASNTAANLAATVSGTVTANQGTLVNSATTNAIINSAATTNGTVLKGSAGTVYSVVASNINAAVRYLKLYNSTTVTVGTTTPAITIPIPAGGVVNLNLGGVGQRFGTGICIGMTTGAADNDTGAVAAGEIKAMISYI